MQVKHFIRFGSHRETKVFLNPAIKDQIYGIIINANVLAHTPVAIYKLLGFNFKELRYIIEPQTHILQFDPYKYYSTKNKNGVCLKSSVATLFEEYGAPYAKISTTMKTVESEEVLANLETLTKNVLKFQQEFLKNNFQKISEEDGYSDYEQSSEQIPNPLYLIPPYFFVTMESFDKWLKINIQAIEFAKKLCQDLNDLAAELIIEKQILSDKNKRKELVKKYKETGIKTLLLWIDDFDECEENSEIFKELVQFLKEIKKENIEVINLYGGYLSIILSNKRLLSGFCHGPGYGECRAVKPVGGGIPTAKYYLPFIRQRVDFEIAFQILKKKNLLTSEYFKEVCNCEKCRELIKRPYEVTFFQYGTYKVELSKNMRQIPTEDTLINNQTHYLLQRFIEQKNCHPSKDLKDFKAFIEWNTKHRICSTNHLEKWIEVIEQ